MVGTLAQMVALVCHGNAAIAGMEIPQLFPGNSTMRFCESITFVSDRPALGKGQETITVAGTPDQWIGNQLKERVLRLRLRQQPRNNSRSADRRSAGFVAGGRLWVIEAIGRDSKSDYWLSQWEIGNREAPGRKIWRVTYRQCEFINIGSLAFRPLDTIAGELRAALADIRAFSERLDCDGFTECFAQATRALDDPEADFGNKDLYPIGLLAPAARSLLNAATPAWVFGGMGSWNDIGFPGQDREEYIRVSDRLFNLLNEAIEAAASSSLQS